MTLLCRMRIGLAAAVLLASAGAATAQPAFRDASSATVSGGIQHIGAGTDSTSPDCATAVTPTTPAGNNGDLLIAIYTSSDSSSATPSTGWNTLLASNPVADHSARIFWRFADGSGNDNLSVARGGTCDVAHAQMARFRNVDTTTPFDTGAPIPAGNCTTPAANFCSYQDSSSVTSGPMTTTTAAAMSLFAVFIRDNNGTNPSGDGFTETFDSGTNTGIDARVALSYRQETIAGAKAAITVSAGGGSDPNHGVLFALRPATPSPSLTINTPAATQTGDLMVAAIAVVQSDVVIATPSGWTAQTAGVQTSANASRQQIFVKFAAASDLGSSTTWTFSGGAHLDAAGGIASYAGVDSTPIDAFLGTLTASGSSHTATGITTTVANARVVATFSYPSSRTWAPQGSLTERVDIASLPTNNTSGIALGMADLVQLAAGATGDQSSNAGGGAAFDDPGVAHLIALKPSLYFDILHGDAALACDESPISITIIARSSSGAVLTGYTGLVNLSTSAGGGTWTVAAANGTLTDTTPGDGIATYQFVANDKGMVRLNLGSTATNNRTVSVQDNATGITSTGATITFGGNGYKITPDTVQVAGKNQTITVSFFQAGSSCVTPSTGNGHGGDNPVKLWLTTAPSHPALATLPDANGVSALSPVPTAEPGANNITLGFVNGTATFTLATTDVGKYFINVRDTNSARRGSSEPITTRPFGIAFRGATEPVMIQHGADHTSAILAAAGDNFSMTLGAYRWASGEDSVTAGTVNNGANIADNGLTARFAADVVVAPSVNLPGVALGAMSRGVGCASTATITAGTFSGGAASATDWCYSEVGNVLLTATATNYLDSPGVNVTGNSGMDGTGTGGGHVGRFRPKRFALDGATPPTLDNRALLLPCVSTFSYMDEAIRLTLKLLAQNAQGATTTNYNGSYARHDPTTGGTQNPKTAFGLGAVSSPTYLTSRVSAVYATGTAPSWANGVLTVPAANAIRASVGRAAAPDDPDGPYTGVAFGIAPTDADGVAMDTLDLDAEAPAAAERKTLGVSTIVRFGRLRMLNALGSEKLDLPVQLRTEYWTGSAFGVNTLDSCTSIPRDRIALGSYTGTLNPSGGNCKTYIQQDPVSFASGTGTMTLVKPSVSGSVLITPQLGSTFAGVSCDNASSGEDTITASALMGYLLGRWSDASNPDSNANTNYDDNPASRAVFGVYGSQPSNFIYFRENY